ncbi:hypothetical protein HDU83_005920 [Entophlyctis luteolus]|nr:hypothetical protein HDU83_005920 [Entophlyctis luteolus]
MNAGFDDLLRDYGSFRSFASCDLNNNYSIASSIHPGEVKHPGGATVAGRTLSFLGIGARDIGKEVGCCDEECRILEIRPPKSVLFWEIDDVLRVGIGLESPFTIIRHKEEARAKKAKEYFDSKEVERALAVNVGTMSAQIEECKAQAQALTAQFTEFAALRDKMASMAASILVMVADSQEQIFTKFLDDEIKSIFTACTKIRNLKMAHEYANRAVTTVLPAGPIGGGERTNADGIQRMFLCLHYLENANAVYFPLRTALPLPTTIDNLDAFFTQNSERLYTLQSYAQDVRKFLRSELTAAYVTAQEAVSNAVGIAEKVRTVRSRVLQRQINTAGINTPLSHDDVVDVTRSVFEVNVDTLNKMASGDVVVKNEKQIGKCLGQVYVNPFDAHWETFMAFPPEY